MYAHLARQLSARGHAVYRFAKLGPGTGSVATDPDLAATVRTWDGRLTIATAALDAMRRELDARGVVVDRTIAAGHSEGAVVVSRFAVSDRANELDGVVLLAGPSVGILGIMREQIGFGVAPELLEDARRRLDEVIVFIRRGEPIPAATCRRAQEWARRARDDARRWPPLHARVDATDPLRLAREMSQPVLVVQGGDDSSVPTHHGEALRDALRGRDRGATRTEYLFVPDVTHMFKVVPADVTGPEAFGYPGETDARVADGIDRWIRGTTRARPALLIPIGPCSSAMQDII